jgi:V8-like Glu-specific endopeptidase
MIDDGIAMLGPTSANADGKEFTDANGRRWKARGNIKPVEINVVETEKKRRNARDFPPPGPDPLTLSREELAKMLRPVRLVGEFSYELDEPDFLIADRILEMKTAPNTEGSLGEADAFARHIIGTDDRTRVEGSRYRASTCAHLSQNCTATMIGPSTAHCAAHCFHDGDNWINSRSITFGADIVGGVATAPFGSFLADSLTFPSAWLDGTPANPNWDWDFAVLEFSPSRPDIGRRTGWLGTSENFNGAKTMIGYPTDKPVPTPWAKGGTFASVVGGRYRHNLDIIPGDSGAAAYGNGDDCSNGIQSSQWRNGSAVWNEVRKWDATTYNFFDAYGNWPRA